MRRTRLSIMMFAQYFAWGAWFVPLGTFMASGLGFGHLIGAAYGMMGIGTIVSTLFVGMIADRYLPAQKALGILSVAAGAALLWLALARPGPAGFLTGILIHFLCFAPTLPLANTIVLSAITTVEREFPMIRIWGTIGWIISGILVGSLRGAAASSLPLLLAAGIFVALGLFAFALPDTPPRAGQARGRLIDILGLDLLTVADRGLWVFLGCTLLLMVPKSFYDAYANSFLSGSGLSIDLGGWHLEATAIQTLGQLSETVFMLALPLLLLRLGMRWVLAIGMAAWGLRFLAFAFGHDGSLVVVPLLIAGIAVHGVCYDFLLVAGQIWMDRAVPSAMRARAQSLYTLVTQGVGVVVGSNIAAWVYARRLDADGTPDWRAFWLIAAGIALATMILFLLVFRKRDERAGSVATESIASIQT